MSASQHAEPSPGEAVPGNTTINTVRVQICLQEWRTCALRSRGRKRQLTETKENAMSTIHFHQTTTSTPEQFIAGLTDFGPGRSKVFSNSAESYLKVHRKGMRDADVTEGGHGTWERLYYDWSDPNIVGIKATDSNVFGGASGYTYTLTPQPNGTTDVDVVIVREGKNLKGHVVAGVLGTVGKSVLRKAFVHSVKAIEARNDP